MKTLAICLLSLLPISVFSQVKVDGIDINQVSEISYIEIVGTQKFLSTKVTVSIDYGQKVGWTDQRIEKEDGKPVVFNSMVEALNFMEKNGWGFVNNYVVTIGQQNVYRYLLKKKESKL